MLLSVYCFFTAAILGCKSKLIFIPEQTYFVKGDSFTAAHRFSCFIGE